MRKNKKCNKKAEDTKFINRCNLLKFINNTENIYGMSFTYPNGWIKVKDLLNFIEKGE